MAEPQAWKDTLEMFPGGVTQAYSRTSRGSCLFVRREMFLSTLLMTEEEAVTTEPMAPAAQFLVVSQKQRWK